MSEFKPIETQEDFDKAIDARLKREYAKAVKETEDKYSDYETLKAENTSLQEKFDTANSKLTESKAKVDELTIKVQTYETNSAKMRIAHEFKIPYDMADRIKGSTEDEMKKDAETIAKYMKSTGYEAPLGGTEEPPKESDVKEGMKKMLKNLKGEQ